MDKEVIIFGNVPLTRKSLYFSLVLCLVVPLLIVIGYGVWLGIPFVLMGGMGGWFVLRLWEKKMQSSVSQLVREKLEHLPPAETCVGELEKIKIGYEHQINLLHSSVAKSKDEVLQLNLEMERKREEMRLAYLEFEDFRKEYSRLEEEASHVHGEAQNALKHKDSLLSEYQKTIGEQRMILEKKQRYISKLEGKVRDLMYEIRSLLQLENTPGGFGEIGGLDINDQEMIDSFLLPSTSPSKPYDLSVQLHKYIEKAENLTGMDHLGYVGGKSPRFLDLTLECYAVDRRRLFDTFKDENAGIVFIHSPMEGKFLFVNHIVKSLIGWSPEKFMKEFPRLLNKHYHEWQEAIGKIKTVKECSIRVALLNKEHQPKPFECYLGMISKGPFTNHVIGILVGRTQ